MRDIPGVLVVRRVSSRIVGVMKKSEALKILGLADGASDDEIKKAHRKLVIAHHPDKFPLDSKEHAEAEELTKQINEARDVLINRSWSPEFDPRRDPRPYAGNPYAHPAGSAGQGGASGQGNPFDPFAGWPFGGAAQGQTTYVWTRWDDIFSGAAGSQRPGSQQNGSGQRAGGAEWPFGGFTVEYDPFDPFAPFRAARAQQQTGEEVFARSKKGLRDEALMVAAKVVALVVLSIAGSSATGLFLYVMASIIYGLYKRMGSLLVMLLVPIMIFGAPLIFMLAPRNGFVGAPLTVAFLVSVLFDVQNLRDRIRTYQAAKVGL